MTRQEIADQLDEYTRCRTHRSNAGRELATIFGTLLFLGVVGSVTFTRDFTRDHPVLAKTLAISMLAVLFGVLIGVSMLSSRRLRRHLSEHPLPRCPHCEASLGPFDRPILASTGACPHCCQPAVSDPIEENDTRPSEFGPLVSKEAFETRLNQFFNRNRAWRLSAALGVILLTAACWYVFASTVTLDSLPAKTAGLVALIASLSPLSLLAPITKHHRRRQIRAGLACPRCHQPWDGRTLGTTNCPGCELQIIDRKSYFRIEASEFSCERESSP